jgi:transposase
VGRLIGVTHQTVQRCVGRAVQFGVMAALDDSPRPGQAPKITDDAKAWVVSLGCQKAKELGYPHELWTTRLLENRHRSREFVGFLEKLDAAYPTDTAIKLILDNHSAHISKETKAWLATQPKGRFTFVFTPKHGSWLNLVEGFFSKMARSMLRGIRVVSKDELKERILAYLDDLNRDPVVHSWTYKIDAVA